MGWNNADIISKSDPLFQELEHSLDFISYIHTSLNVEIIIIS